MKRRCVFGILILFVCLIIAGCGYTVRGFSSKYKSVYVAPFKNSIDITSHKSEYRRYRSYFPLMESTITQKTVDRFIFDSNIKIARENEAEVILKGELIEYERAPLRYADNNEDVTEYRITVWVNIILYDGKTNEIIWTKNHFPGDDTYELTGSRSKSERNALSDAIEDLARRIVEVVVEGDEW